MKYSIITPTYIEHFQFVKKYLESFDRFLVDKDQIEFVFTIRAKERKEFEHLVSNFSSLNIIIYEFEDILESYGVGEQPDDILQRYGKFNFQTLKKFYTILYHPTRFSLVLDSESMLVKSVKMRDIFENYFSKPYIIASSLSERDCISDLMNSVVNARNFLLKTQNDLWFLESFMWFYDKQIVNDLVSSFGYPIDWLCYLSCECPHRFNLFEIDLYHSFIYLCRDKYGYKLKFSEDILRHCLGRRGCFEYHKRFKKLVNENGGLLEHVMLLLNEKCCNDLANMLNLEDVVIIRCEYTNYKCYQMQSEFIKHASIVIMAASQNHAFGLNCGDDSKFKKSAYFYKKYEKHRILSLKQKSRVKSVFELCIAWIYKQLYLHSKNCE